MTTLQNPDTLVVTTTPDNDLVASGDLGQKPGRRLGRLGPGEVEPLDRSRLMIVATLGVIAVLGAWFVLFALYFSNLQESHRQHVLYTQLRPALAMDTLPFGSGSGADPAAKPGEAIALLKFPALGLKNGVIVEGTSSKDLESGPGHYPASPFPGQPGTSFLFGRSATFGSPFGKVHSLKPGETFTVVTGQGTFGYTVLDVRGPHDPRPSAAQYGASSVTLVTSTGSGWRSGWAPSHAIFADATLTSGKIAAAPAGQPTTAPAADGILAGDTGHLVPLVLWLQALILLSAAVAFAHDKVLGWQLWLVGFPAFAAVLWGATSSVLLLLPNLA